MRDRTLETAATADQQSAERQRQWSDAADRTDTELQPRLRHPAPVRSTHSSFNAWMIALSAGGRYHEHSE